MNKKSKIIILLVVLTICIFGIVYFFTVEDKKTSLTISQKKWIENNKNKVIDFKVLDGVSVVSNDGRGLVFDFLGSLQNDTGLEFNKLSVDNTNYALVKKEKVDSNDLILYQDNYVLVTNNKKSYNDIDEVKNLTVGVQKNDITKVSNYLTGSNNLAYKSYDKVSDLFSALKNKDVDAIAVSKLEYMDDIIKNKMHVAYNIFEYKVNYVIKLGDDEKLNKIITKYFKNWQKTKYEKSFNKYFADNYFTYKKISEKSQAEFRSKRYTYGFVINSPFEAKVNDRLKGFNYEILNNFAKTAGIEIDYKQYSSLDMLLKDFDENKLDIVFDNFDKNKFSMDTYKTSSIYDSKVAIITDKQDIQVNNVTSLIGRQVQAVKGTKIANYLKANGVLVKEHKNLNELISNLKSNDIAAIDEASYDYFVRFDLKQFVNIHTIDINDNYGFMIRDVRDNKKLNEFFDFYLSFVDSYGIANSSYKSLISSNNTSKKLQVILSSIVIVLLAIAAVITRFILGKKKRINSKLSKTDKLRYIDALTSLKNRNYLNDNIALWDSSEVYPQAVVIIDLNNIAYINDNFGHTEGDKVIVEAASVLISNQLSDSEILRTNGNEFLIYIAKHDEKAIVTYIRRLKKEFKELSHGFGAAIGYSMIFDEIKTIDDAINEATTDMRLNKEEVNN